jgi:hypothetical protein
MRGGSAQGVSVHTGLSDGNVTEIIDGDLKEGDQVVVDMTGAEAAPSAAASPTSLRRLF